MGRWEPNARGRLEQAALELFEDRGFDETTVAQIAQRAGLSERTFFRHYADKREVLFAGGELVSVQMTAAIDAAPEGAAPMDAVAAALDAFAAGLHERRDFARRRARVVGANVELQERELMKLSSWADLLADALRRRGVGDPAAGLAGQAGIGVLHVAFGRWVAGGTSPELADVMTECLAELRAVTAAG